MKKVYLQFRSKTDLMNFLEYTKNPLCVVDADNNRLLCQLSEDHIEYALEKCNANLLPDLLNSQ